jgi:tRNA(fMet)-specific endonuclease VapC
MAYILDTCVCIEVIQRRGGAVLDHIAECPVGSVCISAVTLSEPNYGVEKSRDPERNRSALILFLASIPVLPYDDRAAQACGLIRAALECKGRIIEAMDMLIAAHALAAEATLITNKVRELRQVPGLPVTDWND